METNFQRKVTRTEKFMVLGSWFLLIVGVRATIYAFTPHWLGSLGAVTISFGILYLILHSRRFHTYQNLVYTVLKYWYTKRIQKISMTFTISLLIVVGLELSFLEYGIVKFGEVPIEGKVPKMSIPDMLGWLILQMNEQYNGALRFGLTVFFAEDVEWLIFLILVRRGIILKT